MRRSRKLACCLIAAFAVSAVAASAASAEPVFVTKAVVGEKAASTIPVAGTLGSGLIEAANGTKISCTGGKFTGEITSKTTSANNVTTFSGCESSGSPCGNTGEKEITTKKLAAVLNGVTTSLPGERLFDEKEGRGGIVAEFTCAGVLKVIVRGSVIGTLSGAAGKTAEAAQTGKLVATQKLTFAQSAGKQKYCAFVEGPEKGECEQLESSVAGGAFEKSGESTIAAIKTVPATWGIGVTK